MKKFVTYKVLRDGEKTQLLIAYGDARIKLEYSDPNDIDFLTQNFGDILDHAIQTLWKESVVEDAVEDLGQELEELLTEGLDNKDFD